MICERCNKEFFEDWRRDPQTRRTECKYCSRSCTNARVHSESMNEKISISLKKTYEEKFKSLGKEIKYCKDCGKRLQNKNKTGYCALCNPHLVSLETRQRISDSQRNLVQQGKKKGWQTRPILSYAEQQVRDILDLLGFKEEYIINYPIKKSILGLKNDANYFLDFYFTKYRFDLEIDGSQHKWKDRAASDLIRDKALESIGIRIYRIPWKGTHTKELHEYLQNSVDIALKVMQQV
jgi:hypothetical protein